MKISIFTIFPDIINDFCNKSLLGKALEKKLWELNIINIRDYSNNKHKKVDDKPFGGNEGLVIRSDILGNAIEQNSNNNTKLIYLTPRGKTLDQNDIKNFLNYKDLGIICGRYEGIDQRVIEEYNIEEYSIGDFIIMGGELPALMLIEGIIRCCDEVVHNKNSINNDSFGGITANEFNYLLEYPLYTQPQIWKNRKIPEILVSGNHERIKQWKLEEAKNITKNRRPDLWNKYLENYEQKA